MRKRPIATLALAVALVFSSSPVHAAPSLSEYMETVDGRMWDKLQDWLKLWHAEQHDEVSRSKPIAPVPTASEASAPSPDTVFAANFPDDGLPGNYSHFNPSGMIENRDYGMSRDPIGTDRKVVYFDSQAGLTNGNNSPRASVVTNKIIQPGKEYWNEFSFYLPDGEALDEGTDWSTLGTAGYGAPYGGASPTGLMLERPNPNGPHLLRLGDNDSLLGDAVKIPTDTWVTVTMHYKAATNGWLEMWVNTGDGPKRVQIRGEDRPAYDVIRPGVNDGGNMYASIGVYGNDPRRVYYAGHSVGTTEAGADVDGIFVSANSPGQPTPTVSAPTPTLTPVGVTTGGTGGAYTDRTSRTFMSNGLTSVYHIYAQGLDRTKPLGLIMYGDGSGGYGFDNPTSSYLIGGPAGLKAVAKKHNMVLVVPEAPAPGCPSDNCWYDSTAPAKAKWSSDLMTQVKKQYPIDLERVVTGGYSSGAQWHRWFLPTHGEAQSVDLAVMIAYGGAPAVTAKYSAAYKDDLDLVWNTGTADPAYRTAPYGARGGYGWYSRAGFDTHATWPSGVGHGRSGEFSGILDRAITQHLR